MRRFIAIAVITLGLTAAGPAVAQEKPSRDVPVLLSADQVHQDRKNGLIVASGHVEISRGERILLADQVTLNPKTNDVVAKGNVSLLEPSGEVIFGDYMEMRDEMRQAVIRKLRILFPDKSRLAATSARRIAGVETEMRHAVFSPCKICRDHPGRPPLWQIKARKIIHDEKTKNIEYYDAFLEMFGIPVLYMPYLSHADPTVKRRSGFLVPRFGTKSELGFIFGTPYYFDIAPNIDVTVEPIITGKQGPVFAGEYRHRLDSGRFKFAGSITRADRTNAFGVVEKNQLRGHIKGTGRFEINNTWRWGFDVARASDDTYERRYNFGKKNVLTTDAFLEGFRRRSYASVNAFAYQGLRRQDNSNRTPLILPLAEYDYVGTPNRHGAYVTLNSNLLSLTRNQGADSRRLSFKGAWTLPFRGRSGNLFDLTAAAQGDLYFVNGVIDAANPKGPSRSGVTGRFFPQLSFRWRYPLVRESASVRQLIEPMAALVVGPNGSNPGLIPNEDSQSFEFDDTNLFSLNRFSGRDRVDSGQRIDYGVKFGLYGATGGSAVAFLGQSFRFRDQSSFSTGSGLEDRLSDIVGRVTLTPGENLDLIYRFRFNKDNLRARRNEVTMSAGPPIFRLNTDYIFIDQKTGTGGFGDREEIRLSAQSKFSKYWTVMAHTRRDLTTGGGTISAGARITYEDECFLFSTNFVRSFTRDREIRPSNSLMFRFVYKHLGEVRL